SRSGLFYENMPARGMQHHTPQFRACRESATCAKCYRLRTNLRSHSLRAVRGVVRHTPAIHRHRVGLRTIERYQSRVRLVWSAVDVTRRNVAEDRRMDPARRRDLEQGHTLRGESWQGLG